MTLRAEIAELASTIAFQEAAMAAATVETNDFLNGPECKAAEELLASPEVRKARDFLSSPECKAAEALVTSPEVTKALNLRDACEQLKLSLIEGHAVIEKRKEKIEFMKSLASRSR